MIKTKKFWLFLTLPLVLIGCGGLTNEPGAGIMKVEAVEESPTIDVPLSEDPLEQIDNLQNTIEDFDLLEAFKQIEAAENLEQDPAAPQIETAATTLGQS